VRDGLILVALWCGAVTAFAAALAVLWKIVNPHVDRYVGGAVRRETAQLARTVEILRAEVVSPAGDPSLLEASTAAVEAASRVERKVDAMGNQLGRVSRRVEQVDGRVMITQSVLDQHVQESNAWLERAVEALEEQGIDLPDRRVPQDPHERK
jgi:hypothetical protein